MKTAYIVTLAALAAGCSGSGDSKSKEATQAQVATAAIAISGSSTVLPVSEAIAEEFQKSHAGRVTVTGSGTGAGFKTFCAKEAGIIGASRPITAGEVEQCKAKGVEYFELPIAYDGIAVVVHPSNTWVDRLTVQELKKLWEPAAEGKVKTWAQIRPGFPEKEIHLFGPGQDSGTYDYFTKAIVGEERHGRADYTASEDDQVLVRGVAHDELALGFFGLAYYEKNKHALKAVPIDDGLTDNGAGPVAATQATILDHTYQPLSRPLFLYVSQVEAQRPEVRELISFALQKAPSVVQEVGYIVMPSQYYQLTQARFDDGKTGSLFAGHGSTVGANIGKALGAH